jgi:hypothetical protein
MVTWEAAAPTFETSDFRVGYVHLFGKVGQYVLSKHICTAVYFCHILFIFVLVSISAEC